MGAEPTGRLRPVLGLWSLFALSFGCTVGSGWVVVIGDWLGAAGPGGTLLGLMAGAAVMLAVCGAYAELALRIPRAGADFEYARRIFGPGAGFIVGWFLTLALVAVAAFEGGALCWILSTLLPALRGPVLYRMLGAEVGAGDLIIGFTGTVAICVFNCRGVEVAAGFQRHVTLLFIGICLCVIAAGLASGSPSHLVPPFASLGTRPWWQGSLWIFASAPVFLNGFQSVAQVAEERGAGVSVSSLVATMYAAVLAACLFYCGIVIAASGIQDWRRLPGAPLPAFAAFEHVWSHQALGVLLLSGAALSVVKTWNGMVMWSTRLILAQARVGMLPHVLARLSVRHGAPWRASVLVSSLSALLLSVGRGILVPLLDTTSIAVVIGLVVVCAAAIKVRRSSANEVPSASGEPGCEAERIEPDVPRPGLEAQRSAVSERSLWLALAGTSTMAVYAVSAPWFRRSSPLPIEWAGILVWAIAGAVVWLALRRKRRGAHS